MSRSKGNGNANVFKLSGNLALGANDYNNDYSNINRQYAKQQPTLNYQKSYNQVNNKANQYLDMKYGNNNYDGSYSNQGKRSQNNNISTNDYSYKGSSTTNNERSYGRQNIYSDQYTNNQNKLSNNPQKYNQYPPQQQKYDYNYNDVGQLPQKKSSIRQNNNKASDYSYQYSQPGKSKSNINSYGRDFEKEKSYQYQQKSKAQSKIPSYSRNKQTQQYSNKNIQNIPKRNNQISVNRKNNNRDYRDQQQEVQYNSKLENQRRLKQKQNVQIKQYDPSTFVECRAGCGRKFNPDSITKHQKICKKVFQKKRKQFNVQEQRIVAKDQVKLMKQGEIVEKKMEQKKKNQKIPKWKAQSLAFRAVLKSNKPGTQMTQQQKKILDQSSKVGYIQCKFCGRSFNQQAGKRHIPFCEQQQKKNAMKKRK